MVVIFSSEKIVLCSQNNIGKLWGSLITREAKTELGENFKKLKKEK
jgi:hypothetical protein